MKTVKTVATGTFVVLFWLVIAVIVILVVNASDGQNLQQRCRTTVQWSDSGWTCPDN